MRLCFGVPLAIGSPAAFCSSLELWGCSSHALIARRWKRNRSVFYLLMSVVEHWWERGSVWLLWEAQNDVDLHWNFGLFPSWLAITLTFIRILVLSRMAGDHVDFLWGLFLSIMAKDHADFLWGFGLIHHG